MGLKKKIIGMLGMKIVKKRRSIGNTLNDGQEKYGSYVFIGELRDDPNSGLFVDCGSLMPHIDCIDLYEEDKEI